MSLAPFTFNSQEVEFVEHSTSKYAFGMVADDLAKIIGASSGREIARSICTEWKGVQNMHTLGGTQPTTVIWEPGIYQYLSISRKPKAKPFQLWLFEEVLPSIRKTGSYSLPNTKLLEEAEAKVKQLEQRIQAEAHLVLMAESLIYHDKDSISLTELAKVHGIGRTEFFRLMREIKFLQSRPAYVPYQTHITNKRAEVYRVERPCQPGVYDSVTVVSAKGQEYLAKKMLEKKRIVEVEVQMEAII